jgi:hypothetical protein
VCFKEFLGLRIALFALPCERSIQSGHKLLLSSLGRSPVTKPQNNLVSPRESFQLISAPPHIPRHSQRPLRHSQRTGDNQTHENSEERGRCVRYDMPESVHGRLPGCTRRLDPWPLWIPPQKSQWYCCNFKGPLPARAASIEE